jgi:hypothetical protein
MNGDKTFPSPFFYFYFYFSVVWLAWPLKFLHLVTYGVIYIFSIGSHSGSAKWSIILYLFLGGFFGLLISRRIFSKLKVSPVYRSNFFSFLLSPVLVFQLRPLWFMLLCGSYYEIIVIVIGSPVRLATGGVITSLVVTNLFPKNFSSSYMYHILCVREPSFRYDMIERLITS